MGRRKKDRVCGIYCIENLIDNKKYIGYSSHIIRRFRDHKGDLKRNKHENSYLQNAWNKHGEENFYFWIIQECTQDKLGNMEIYWICYYNSFYEDGEGYNLTRGGENPPSFLGKTVTEKTKNKIRESQKNIPRTSEWNKKISDGRKGVCAGENHPFFGKHHTEETKEKISKSRREKCAGENHPNFGKKASESFLNLLSDSHVGRKNKKSCFSKYTGVNYSGDDNKPFRAAMTSRGKYIYLGHFETEIEAAMAYNEAITDFYGWKVKNLLNTFSQEEIEELWSN